MTCEPILPGVDPRIRIASMKDHAAMYAFLMDAFEGNSLFSLSEERMRGFLLAALVKKNAAIAVIEDEDGQIAASFGFALDQMWWSDEWHISERWNFVREPYRGKGYGEALIEFSKALSKSWGLALLLGVMSAERAEAKVRLYRKHLHFLGGLFCSGMEFAHGPTAHKVKGD